MVRLPLHPRLAHMVVRGRSTLACDLAALMSERDGLGRRAGADITSRLTQIRGSARDRIRAAAKQVRQVAGIADGPSELSVGVLVALAFPTVSVRRAAATSAIACRAAVERCCPNMTRWRFTTGWPSP